MRKKPTQKFIAFIVLVGLVVITYIWHVSLDDLTEPQEKEIAEHDRNFIPYCDGNEPDWLRMIISSLKTLKYFENHSDVLVTDVGVGTRIMEAQINILLKGRPDLSPEILEYLKELQQKTNLIGDSIVQRYRGYIKEIGPQDAKVARMQKNLQWIISASTWETPATEQWKTLMKDSDQIETADSIDMAVDFGSSTDGCIFGTFENCEIPDYCIDLLWKEPHSGYLLTHQILFHYMMGRNDCFSGDKRTMYESQNLVDPIKFLETMCRRVITETKFIETLNYPITQQDLFVEQILVCSLAGYNDFLTSKWANVVLDWSGESGLLGCYSLESITAQNQSVSRRVKRWDKLYEDGKTWCSVHMGALMLGVIGQQLRYFLEMCYDM